MDSAPQHDADPAEHDAPAPASAPAPAPAPAPDEPHRSLFAHRPLQWGFVVTLGVLLALAVGIAFVNLQSVVLSVFIAAFVALGLDPLIRWFQRRGLRRGTAIVVVILLFVAVVIGIIWIVIPPVVNQAFGLVQSIPELVNRVEASGWFDSANAATNGLLGNLVTGLEGIITDPNLWATIGGNALAFGASVINAVSTGFFVVVLSIYFIATLDSIKQACYSLVKASHRETISGYAERIMQSVGKYLSGMVVLAFMNAVFSTILLAIVGVPFALVIGVVALFVTLIPLIGTVLTTILMTIVSLFVSPVAALIVLAIMLVYMQVEAYVFTPRIMGKAVQVPGTIVLISALAGGTLLGLLGALVAIPISAGILLIIREVVIPRQARA
ncbi:AI-2E family transporter [Agromyces protaetiae]|uniref:AI-2E family transporter n=1 Tax=Agromyces protaetiae TaxID=2509455 RepID=A0A4P6FFB8_9MICO|nr:AI-2E family transporter [Agromyces protaetiae]QAY72437.1 AI-2E family transporter [Agromyces protaetiae]